MEEKEKIKKESMHDRTPIDIQMIRNKPLLVTNESLNFTGNQIFSPNKEYEMLYNSSNNKYNYYIISNRRIIHKGNLKELNDCKISNNGIFISNCGLDSVQLGGCFNIYNPDGTLILKQDFDVNLHTNGISINGKYACIQLVNNSNSKDEGKLLIFDIENRKIISEFLPITGWAIYYSFDEKEQLVSLHYDKNKIYKYTFEGVLLDIKKFEEDILYSDRASSIKKHVFKIIKDLKKQDGIDYNKYLLVIRILNVLLNTNISSGEKAQIHKELGNIYYQYDKKNESLYNFKKALDLNSKIGVKRIYDKLLKEKSNKLK